MLGLSLATADQHRKCGHPRRRADYGFHPAVFLQHQFDSEILWDGNSLTVWANVNGSRVLCDIPRSTIHELPLFSDAVSREIGRDRAEIFSRLRLALVAKIARSRESSIRLHPFDVSARALQPT